MCPGRLPFLGYFFGTRLVGASANRREKPSYLGGMKNLVAMACFQDPPESHRAPISYKADAIHPPALAPGSNNPSAHTACREDM